MLPIKNDKYQNTRQRCPVLELKCPKIELFVWSSYPHCTFVLSSDRDVEKTSLDLKGFKYFHYLDLLLIINFQNSRLHCCYLKGVRTKRRIHADLFDIFFWVKVENGIRSNSLSVELFRWLNSRNLNLNKVD